MTGGANARRTLALGCPGPGRGYGPDLSEFSTCHGRIRRAAALEVSATYLHLSLSSSAAHGPLASLKLRDGYRLDDGRPHHVRLRYIHAHPRNAIVYLDDMTHAALLSGHNMSVTEEFDLGAIADADGAAYVGFTATSGYETAAEHEVLEWHMS